MLHIIGKHERSGRWGSVPLVRLAQAILPADEPKLVSASASPIQKLQSWPAENIFASKEHLDKRELKPSMELCLLSGLPADEIVIAGEIITYAAGESFILTVDHYTNHGVETLDMARKTTVFVGRTFPYYFDERWEPRERLNEFVTLKSGGLSTFINGSLESLPRMMWKRNFGWNIDVLNPFIWKSNGKPVARFERFHGPFLDWFHRAPSDFQPTLGRWVVQKEEWDRIQGEFNINRKIEFYSMGDIQED